jgi:hypothetical protein
MKGYGMTAEDVQEDLQRIDHGDPEITALLEKTRRKTLGKGLPYIEVAKSKTYGTVKYLLKDWPDGTTEVTNLDTNESWTFVPRSNAEEIQRERNRRQVYNWIHGIAA